MRIAYTMAPDEGGTDRLLADVAATLALRSIRTCGVVQINSRRAGSRRCDMDVTILPDGPVIRISESRGPGARGCQLDAGALETAVESTERSLLSGADVVIVNKFGKHEAAGRGFRSVIAEALCRDIPVLVGLNRLNAKAFMEFTAGTAVELKPTEAALRVWLTSQIEDATSAA
ncbi:Nucleoside-triphosphatase THEP1 [Jannaschia faecimaris]|uniref:Nucleoside-triphosphatase THEP1 n=1 Tax=Jannaschia faecimaris TaxID=1244108 RepID=A0A1H3U0A9_9RHOB|nr:DUF2478 domain-containing protein [Jannaschia faecimaris]SDZ55295.1 Nucleoside-triphosphatase THEP1 [Jannaschia faecimaris]